MLSRLDREDPDQGKRTFDCVSCDHTETVIVQYALGGVSTNRVMNAECF